MIVCVPNPAGDIPPLISWDRKNSWTQGQKNLVDLYKKHYKNSLHRRGETHNLYLLDSNNHDYPIEKTVQSTVITDKQHKTFDAVVDVETVQIWIAEMCVAWQRIHTHGGTDMSWKTTDPFQVFLDFPTMHNFTPQKIRKQIHAMRTGTVQNGKYGQSISSTGAFCICDRVDESQVDWGHIVILPHAFFALLGDQRMQYFLSKSAALGDFSDMERLLVRDVLKGYIAHELNHILEHTYFDFDPVSSKNVPVPEDYAKKGMEFYPLENQHERRSELFPSLFSDFVSTVIGNDKSKSNKDKNIADVESIVAQLKARELTFLDDLTAIDSGVMHEVRRNTPPASTSASEGVF